MMWCLLLQLIAVDASLPFPAAGSWPRFRSGDGTWPRLRGGDSTWLRLRGGDADPIILRLASVDGTKRLSVPSDSTTLSELQQLIRTQLDIPPSQQILSLQRGGEPLDLQSEQTLADLGLEHGSTLHLASIGGARSSKSASSQQRRSKAVRVDVIKEMQTNRLDKVRISAAPPADCTFTSIDPGAWENLASYLVDTEMEEMRVALLYGRVSGGKDGEGVQVDVFYEPPQSTTEHTAELLETDEAKAQRALADKTAGALGLKLVGWAFSHPPRSHDVGVAELEHIKRMQQASKSVVPPKTFITMRVRCVYEDEDIDGDVTAEVYQPTEQGMKLLEKQALLADPNDLGNATLRPDLKQEFELAGEPAKSIEAILLLSRVHDMARVYRSPLRTSFPPVNRAAPLRKLHWRNLLTRARDEGMTFSETAADFHFLLHAASLLPEDALLQLCKAVRAKRGDSHEAFQRAETLLCEYADMPPPKSR